MLHPRGPPSSDPAGQTAGGLVRLASVDAAAAAIAALHEQASLTGPGGPLLLVRHCCCAPCPTAQCRLCGASHHRRCRAWPATRVYDQAMRMYLEGAASWRSFR